MTQDHLWVLIGVLTCARGNSPDEPIRIFPRAFARTYLGWSDSKHSKARVLAALQDLQHAAVTDRWADDKKNTVVKFVRELMVNSDGSVMIVLDPSILHLFRGIARTYVCPEDRRELTVGYETWVLMFILSSDCKPHAKFVRGGGFTLGWFRDLCCPHATMSLTEFSGKLVSALRCIKERGAIRDFSIEGDQIKIVKHGAVRRKTPSKLSYWSTKAGRATMNELVGWEHPSDSIDEDCGVV